MKIVHAILCCSPLLLCLHATPQAQAPQDQGGTPPPKPLGESAQMEILDGIIAAMEQDYVDEELGLEAAAFLGERFMEGAYAEIKGKREYALALTADLQEITSDKHLVVGTFAQGPGNRPPDVPSAASQALEQALRRAREQLGR